MQYTGTLTITGIDLSQAGTSQWAMALSADAEISVNGSTCTLMGYVPATLNFAATWNGSTGTNLVLEVNNQFSGTGSFTATGGPPPVFPMTITGQITQTASNASATIQPRAQDLGTVASVFVFAHAPSNLVIGAAPRKQESASPPSTVRSEDAIVCVLAQVNASGQLVAVSSSTMQAYLTGVLGAQNQAIQILNNVSTQNVAGTTMFVGYGANAASMLNGGVYEAAISIPGTVQCAASLSSAPAPQSPGVLTGLWWNPAESGWGVHFTQRSDVVVATWYTYDASGNAKWYIAPSCRGPSGSTGTCTGAVYEVNGPRFFGVPFAPIAGNQVSQAGNLSVNFTDANNALMTFSVAGVSRTVAITRQIFPIPATPAPAVDYTDLWWNPKESGWGLAITQQNGDIFLAWYVYDANGKPVWYVAPNCDINGSSCSGLLYRTTGPAFATTFDTNQVKGGVVGSAIVSFIDANNAVLSYTVDGVSGTKTITRQIFP